jgi:hypothetical protein
MLYHMKLANDVKLKPEEPIYTPTPWVTLSALCNTAQHMNTVEQNNT